MKKSKFRSRDEAYREMVRIGSMVAVDHQPFEDVAKEFSQGVTAKSGGERPWVKTGELASKPLEDAVFSQPVGQLSAEIIEDDTCFYIIRVKERHEKVTEPFVDAQVQIRKSIVDERTEAARKAYIDRLRKEIPVFTVFDGIPSPEERAKAQKQGAFGRVHEIVQSLVLCPNGTVPACPADRGVEPVGTAARPPGAGSVFSRTAAAAVDAARSARAATHPATGQPAETENPGRRAVAVAKLGTTPSRTAPPIAERAGKRGTS